MANRSYLLSVNDQNITWSHEPRREILAEGIYEIPIFWASLFVRGERQIDTYEAEEGESEIPNWWVEAAVAKQTIELLRRPITLLLDDRSGRLWQQWVDLLASEEVRFFKTNAAELWSSADPAEYDDYWNILLQAFANPSTATMRAAVERNGLQYNDGSVSWSDEEETICKLAGAPHIRGLPWLD